MQKDLKVLFDYSIFFHQNIGGISRYIINLNEKLQLNNIDSNILAPLHQNIFLKKNYKNIKNFYVNKFPKNTYKLSKLYNDVFTKIYLKTCKPNIIHQTYFVGDYLKQKKIKKVINVYDLVHEIFYNEYNLKPNTLPKKKFLEYADLVLCPSKKTKKDLLNFYPLNEKKIKVVNIGISDINKIKIKNDLIPTFPFILYVGYRGKYKNFKNLITALNINKKILNQFKLICFGGGKFSKEEKDFINSKNIKLSSIIQLDGDDDRLAALYSSASAFIFPSIYEGQGLPQIEAMSFGCPVICSNHEAVVEATSDSAVLFNPLSAEDIAFKIENTLFSDTILNNLKKKSILRAKKFTMQRCFEETLLAYKEIT